MPNQEKKMRRTTIMERFDRENLKNLRDQIENALGQIPGVDLHITGAIKFSSTTATIKIEANLPDENDG